MNTVYSYTYVCTNNFERDRNFDRSVRAERVFQAWEMARAKAQTGGNARSLLGMAYSLVSQGVLAEDRKVNLFQCLKGTKY